MVDRARRKIRELRRLGTSLTVIVTIVMVNCRLASGWIKGERGGGEKWGRARERVVVILIIV